MTATDHPLSVDLDPPRAAWSAALPIDTAALTMLERRLTERATQSGLVDVAYRTIDTPVGRLLLAATERGVVRVAFEVEEFDAVLATLADRISPRILAAPAQLDDAARQLDEYFAGDRTSFDLPLDHTLAGGFRLEVQEFLPRIAYGTTLTYTQVASEVGRPKAVRAVGTACATNPHPVLVPCHRVLRSDGSVGGYLGGPEVKRTLLQFEGAEGHER